MNVNVQWGRGPSFAEVAEALEVPTDQIVAMASTRDDEYTVLYSEQPFEEGKDKDDVYAQTLKRDADGILVRFGGAKHVPGYWRALLARIEGRMGGLDGDND